MISLLLTGLLLLWAQLFFAAHRWWSADRYADFGWIVPAMAVWFFWRRHRSLAGGAEEPMPEWGAVPSLLVGGLVFLALFLFRFVERSDPFWRAPLWLHAVTVAAIHHVLLSLHGYPRGFAWITLFALAALPLPDFLERLISGHFMEFLAGVAECVANVQGLPVLRNGNALIANGEVLHVSEGCSGVRTLQGLIMISLLCGELFRLSPVFRVALLGLAPMISFACNAVRTLVLTSIYFRQGPDAFEGAHDRVGAAGFACSLVLMAGMAWLLRKLPARD